MNIDLLAILVTLVLGVAGFVVNPLSKEGTTASR